MSEKTEHLSVNDVIFAGFDVDTRSQEIYVTENRAFENAMYKLNSDDYERMRHEVDLITKGRKNFANISALELFAKLGIFLNAAGKGAA